MKTRIRYHRKLRHLTQSDVAKLIGTTAATVSRLETSDMNVSMTWLQRFADAFNIPVSELIDESSGADTIPCIGEIGRSGALLESDKDDDGEIRLESFSRNPVAARICENFGQYCEGDVIIADRMSADQVTQAIGRDCIVEIEGEESGFGRLISSDNGTYLLVPPEPGAKVRSFPLPSWVAPVVMLIRYL